MIELNLKGFFVCNKCRDQCYNGCDTVGVFGPDFCPKAYFPRKQSIKCLGPLCDVPCELQEVESDVTIEQLVNLIMYLGTKLNERIEEEQCQKNLPMNK